MENCITLSHKHLKPPNLTQILSIACYCDTLLLLIHLKKTILHNDASQFTNYYHLESYSPKISYEVTQFSFSFDIE
jgi:hypothetical protein